MYIMTYQKFYTALIGIILAASILFTGYAGIESNETQLSVDNHKVFELRTYTTHDGKLDDLHARFANHTIELFEKHGMENIGYWTPMDKENTLTYIIAHESREVAEESWDGFRNDPEWQEAYQASRTDGPLVESIESVFLTSTDYSPLK